jgi:hypothetical protein
MYECGWEPSKFANLPRKEKALTIAFIKTRLEAEKKKRTGIKRRKGKR